MSAVQPTPSSDGPIEQVEHSAATYIENQSNRDAIIADIKAATAGKPRWVRYLQAIAFIVGGAVVVVHGSDVFDGYSAVVGGAFVTAGGAELVSLLQGK